MVLFRRLLGDVLRDKRTERGLTLREVSAEARVSLGYISEIERGQKEASSELLSSLCDALEVPLSDVLREVSDAVAVEEAAALLTSTRARSARAPAPRSWPPPRSAVSLVDGPARRSQKSRPSVSSTGGVADHLERAGDLDVVVAVAGGAVVVDVDGEPDLAGVLEHELAVRCRRPGSRRQR